MSLTNSLCPAGTTGETQNGSSAGNVAGAFHSSERFEVGVQCSGQWAFDGAQRHTISQPLAGVTLDTTSAVEVSVVHDERLGTYSNYQTSRGGVTLTGSFYANRVTDLATGEVQEFMSSDYEERFESTNCTNGCVPCYIRCRVQESGQGQQTLAVMQRRRGSTTSCQQLVGF
jgi:hypothetical protein